MRRRPTSVYPSAHSGNAQAFQGEFHSNFPEITQPDRSWYLPIIDAIYLHEEASSDRELEYEWHEQVHSFIGKGVATCELRGLAFVLLANVTHLLTILRV